MNRVIFTIFYIDLLIIWLLYYISMNLDEKQIALGNIDEK